MLAARMVLLTHRGHILSSAGLGDLWEKLIVWELPYFREADGCESNTRGTFL
jgi:hypothetical protein